MQENNGEDQAQQLWQSFDENHQELFWDAYGSLLLQVKENQESRVQHLKDGIVTKPLFVVGVSKDTFGINFLLWLGLVKIFLRQYIWALLILGSVITYIGHLYFKTVQSGTSVKKEKWLYASLNNKEKRIFDYLMDRKFRLQGFDNRGKKLDYIMYKFSLIDWSKTPVNLTSETEPIYELFEPGDRNIMYIEKSGQFYKVLQVLNKYYIQMRSGKMEKTDLDDYKLYYARLFLSYLDKPVIVRKSIYQSNVFRNSWQVLNTSTKFYQEVPNAYYIEDGIRKGITNRTLIEVKLRMSTKEYLQNRKPVQ